MRSTTKCFRISKVCFRRQTPETRQKYYCKHFDNALYHLLSFGCSLTVIKAQVESMLHLLSMDPLHPAYSTYGTNKVMLFKLTNTCR